MALEPIKGNQIPTYDAVSREIDKAAETLEAISVARLNADARRTLEQLITDLRKARHEFFSTAHAAFVLARQGET